MSTGEHYKFVSGFAQEVLARKPSWSFHYDRLAQLVEHKIEALGVRGSNP